MFPEALGCERPADITSRLKVDFFFLVPEELHQLPVTPSMDGGVMSSVWMALSTSALLIIDHIFRRDEGVICNPTRAMY